MKKGIAQTAILLLLVGTVTVGVVSYGIYHSVTTGQEVSQSYECISKRIEYCTYWFNMGFDPASPPTTWDPDCGNKPTLDECKSMMSSRPGGTVSTSSTLSTTSTTTTTTTIPSLNCDTLCKNQGFASGVCRETTPAVSGRIYVATKVDYLHTLNSTELAELAKYDLLITWLWDKNKDAISKLYEMNPEMKIFGYHNVGFISNKSEFYEIARDNNWILKDEYGNEVHSFPKNPDLKRIDPGNSDYREWLADLIKTRSESLGIEGVTGDITAAKIDIVNADPINPRTGNFYTDQEYATDMTALVKRVREKSGKLYIGNGAGTIQGCWKVGFWYNKEIAEPLVNEEDGTLLEGFIRFSDYSNWRSVNDWKEDLEYLNYLNKKNKITLAWTITSGNLPANTTRYQIAMFGFATYLLAKSGDSNYFVARGYENKFYDVSKTDVGYPLEDYHIIAGTQVYEREFSKTRVLINPSNDNYIINLGGNYKTLDGKTVSSIKMNAHTGEILLKIPEESGCLPEETPIEDGCDAGFTCCCSHPSEEPYDFKKYIALYAGGHSWEGQYDYLSKFDLIDTGHQQAEYVVELKKVKPEIIVLFYKDLIGVDSPETAPWNKEEWDFIDQHEEWFLHDIDGNRIRMKEYRWYLMNPSNNEWRNYFAGRVKDVLDNSEFDGVFLDDCWGTMPISPPTSWNWFTVPDDKIPKYIEENWNDWIIGMLKVVKNKIGNKLLVINCNRNPSVYIDYVDGRLDEGFVHGPWQSAIQFHSLNEWKEDVDSLYEWEIRDKYFLANAGIDKEATKEDRQKFMMFCLSSYLLGANGPKSMFGFSPESYSYKYGLEWYHPEYDRVTELGAPTGKYYLDLESSIYVRDFKNGKVLVNPSTTTHTITLDQNYKTLDGKEVSSITLNDHSGVILKVIP